MTATTSKLGADMLTDDQEIELRALILEYGLAAVIEGAQDRPRQLNRVVDYVRALLARQPAAIDKEGLLRKIRITCESRFVKMGDDYALGANQVARDVVRLLDAAPLVDEASKPAPSVEQDERGAFYRKALYQIAYWLDGGQEQIQKFALSVLDGEPATIGELDPHDALRYMACREAAIERGLFATPEEYDAMVDDSLRKKGKEVLTGRGHNYGKKVAKDGSLYRPAACELTDEQADTLKPAPSVEQDERGAFEAAMGHSAEDLPNNFQTWQKACAWQRSVATPRQDDPSLVRELQKALFYWMPSIAGEDSPAGQKAAEHAYLLIGLDDNSTECWGDQILHYVGTLHREQDRLGLILSDAGCTDDDDYLEFVESLAARAASTSANVAQAGYKLVPTEPTAAMVNALWDALPKGFTFSNCTPTGVVASIIAAAPAQSANVARGAEARPGEREMRAMRLLEIAEPILEAAALNKPVTMASGDLLRQVRNFLAAPPAQTALTEHDLRNIEGCLTGSGYVGTMAKVRAALTAAQSASGDQS